MRPAHQRRQHLAGGVHVIINRLLAQDHQIRRFLGDDRLQDFRDRERFQHAIMLHQDAAISAHGQRRANLFLRHGGACGYRDDFGGHALFLEPHGFFHRDFVKGVHGHFDIGSFNARAIRLHADLDVVIHHPLDGDQKLHDATIAFRKWGADRRRDVARGVLAPCPT